MRLNLSLNENNKKSDDDIISDIFMSVCSRSNVWIALYDLSSWGINLNDYPNLRRKIDSYKEVILKNLIEGMLNTKYEYDSASIKQIIDRLNSIHVNCPELGMIITSLKNDGLLEMITYDDSDYNAMSEEEQIKYVKNDVFHLNLINNPSIDVQIAAIRSDPVVLIAPGKNTNINLNKNAILQCKDTIIKVLLQKLIQDHIHAIKQICEILWYFDIEWSEVNTIIEALRKDNRL